LPSLKDKNIRRVRHGKLVGDILLARNGPQGRIYG